MEPTKPFNVMLTAAHRAELERMRIAFGCRSHADALRALIERQAWEAADDVSRGVAPVAPVDRLERGVAPKVVRDSVPALEPAVPKLAVQLGPTKRRPGEMAKKR